MLLCNRSDLRHTELQRIWCTWRSHEKTICVSSSLSLPPVLCTYHETFLDPNFCHIFFSPCLAFFFLHFFLLCLVLMDERENIFPGNLLYLQSSDMAARPLLINSPLNFNRLIINYWGINVQIQLCCPCSVHKCQQRYFMAYAVERSNSPITSYSHISAFWSRKKMIF